MRTGFYEDTKYCSECARYVHYLRALERCYCAVCGARVRLFSSRDLSAFRAELLPERSRSVPFPGWERDDERESA